MSKKITIGILAHVDAGKTTLSENILYRTGSIRKMGRVDHKDTYLDTYDLEKARGITIFSKQAVFDLEDIHVTLLDTPGHVDFSSEMERTLQVLDYAVLLINGADGVQGHTATLWKLLERYSIPTFIFINKMDQVGTNRQDLLSGLQKDLHRDCIDFSSDIQTEVIEEDLASIDEKLMDKFLLEGTLTFRDLKPVFHSRQFFPVYFGSALKDKGVDDLLKGIVNLSNKKTYPKDFGARVFNVTRDEKGNRLTHVKVSGGRLKVKDVLVGKTLEAWEEKVNEIRIYSGKQWTGAQEVEAGSICALTGLSMAKIGEGLGFEDSITEPVLSPVLNYKINMPDSVNTHEMLNYLYELEEEEPHLNVVWNKKFGEIHVQVMGEVELEILKSIIKDRYGVDVDFDAGSLVYKETIKDKVIGIGHFEPLRHYAEVHLMLEAGEKGSGITYELKCSEDVLARNWQRLILSHLKEKHHKGVLTGSHITDVKITVIGGKAHLKHTEGGDFREATYRAVRQGLMEAESLLLEPVYRFRIDLPTESIGRAMSDIQRMSGRHEEPLIVENKAVLTGYGPVKTMMHYATEVNTYSKGQGRLSLSFSGYEPCHNAEEVLEAYAYDPDLDADNPSGSVFCSKGAGYTVGWEQVKSFAHLDTSKYFGGSLSFSTEVKNSGIKRVTGISQNEVEAIFEQTYGPIKKKTVQQTKFVGQRQKDESYDKTYVEKMKKKVEKDKEKYLLVDGYNIVFSWKGLKELTETNMDLARQKLLDIMSNYQSQTEETIIVVFDAYRVEGNVGSMESYHNIHVVYTKEAETADQYIERLVHHIRPDYEVTVATSDRVEQVIIMAKGARKLSAEGLYLEVASKDQQIEESFMQQEELRNRMEIDWKDGNK